MAEGRVVIVGGGISGLSAAYYLAKAGRAATILEKQPRLGGVIQTNHVEGCVLEGGPDSFLAAKPWALELIRDIGLAGDVIGSNDHLRVTYVWKKDRLVPLPDGLMMMVPTRIAPLIGTRLLSWPTKIRMGLEYLRRPGHTPPGDRTVAEFIRDHYGQESVDYLAEPLLSGVYGGDPTELSASAVLTRFVEFESKYGSITRGVLRERRRHHPHPHHGKTPPALFRTLKGGLGELTEAITRVIAPSCELIHGEAETIERTDGGFRIRVNGEWMDAAHIVIACPAYQAGSLVAGFEPRLAGLLWAVNYSSSLVVSFGYRQHELNVKLDGFGFLVPSRERKRLVACTFVGTKFSHRVPDGTVVVRCFLGGRGDDAILNESDEALIGIVSGELRRIAGIEATPRFHLISRWPRSMAQYTVGHQERVRRIEQRVAALPGLHLAGNAYHGIGVPDCVRMGRQAAERIVAPVRLNP